MESVNARIVEAGRNLRGAMQEFSAAGSEANRDLQTRLGFLQAEFDQITASTRMTAQQRDRAAELRTEIAGLQSTLESRRGAGGLGGGATPSASSSPSGPSAETLAKRAAAERASAAAFAADMARREELALALGEAEREAVRQVHAAEQELDAARKTFADNRAHMAAEEREQAERTIVLLEKRVEAEDEALNAFRAASRSAQASVEARPLSGLGFPGTDEIESALASTKELGDLLKAAFAKAREEADKLVPLNDLLEAVTLADELARAFAMLGDDILSGLARSIGDVISAVDRVGEARDAVTASGGSGLSLGVLGSYVGVATAAAGVVQGMVTSAIAAAEESRRQREAIREAVGATRENTAALRSAAQPASGVSRSDVEAAREIIRELAEGVGRAYSNKYLDPFQVADNNALADATGRVAEFFDRLDALDIEGLDTSAYRRIFEEMVSGIDFDRMSDDQAQAMLDAVLRGITTGDFGEFDELAAMVGDEFVSLAEAAGRVADALGTYADDLGGALAEADDAVEFLGLDGRAALEELVRLIRASGEDLGDLAGVLAAAETGDPAAAVAAAFEAIRAGQFDFGDISANEVEDVLRRLLRAGDAGGSSGSAQATSISSATVAKQDLANAYLQQQLRELRAANVSLDAIRAALASATAGVRPGVPSGAAASAAPRAGLSIPIALSVERGETARETARRVLPFIEEGLVRALTSQDATRGRSE